MKLNITFIFFHTLWVLSSTEIVKEDPDYRNSHQSLIKQRRTDLPNGDSPFSSKDLSKLQNTVISLPEGSIGKINEQVRQNSNRYKESSMAGLERPVKPVKLVILMAIATETPESTSPSASNHCGGNLLGESGVISYKEYEMYNNRESCTWIIEVPEAAKIQFRLEKTGLELGRCCDGVNVTSLDNAGIVQHAPAKLKPYHTVIVDGPKAIVRFYSDESQFGLGFRLTYYKYEIINQNECGGVIVREYGEIAYKFDNVYLDNEHCVWLVHSPNSTSITFRLVGTGLQECCDFVSVTTIDPESGTLGNDIRLLKGYYNPITIQESVAAIVFSSDHFIRGTGFALLFSGSGANTNPKYVYNLRHIAQPNGTIEYPGLDRNDDEITKQQRIYVTAKSAILDTKSSQRFIGGIDMHASDFLRTNDSSCVYDSLTFYEPIPQAIRQGEVKYRRALRKSLVWQKKAQIPKKNDTLLCPERFSVPKQEGFLDFNVDSFLAIYKPISKDTIESNAVVSFDYYYNPYLCLKIVQSLDDEFGIISYKENENYNNLENCSWIIEVTNATRIDFNLEQSGFEECCDYVEVTSLDMTGQTQGATLKLRTGSPTASLTGSRARVNFISDETTFGSGFRLRYGRGKTLDENICGGVMNPMLDDFGVISYKANETYANNEYCQWRIEAPGWGRIGFILEQSGFEDCCDFVSISAITVNGLEIGLPVHLNYNNRNASLAGPTILVRFKSDDTVAGTGFRLRFEKLPVLGHQGETSELFHFRSLLQYLSW